MTLDQMPWLKAILGKEARLADLDDEHRSEGAEMERVFTDMVGAMKDDGLLPLPPINNLMSLFWDLVGHKVVLTGMTTMVTTLSFMAERNNGKTLGVVLCPPGWTKIVAKNPIYQMGGMVFVASQARDLYNDRITDPNVLKRARSHEAEFLLWAGHSVSGFDPCKYQRKVLEEFPKGLASATGMLYESKVFDGGM
jgi:hypothetical protein